ncbi:MAG: right-handed parallel beta-helix repeat-containing protein [bacterium]|nr:right-handed parallel beta-helix repeat-containing protein [Candidatus Sumerlaeota bacterium]
MIQRFKIIRGLGAAALALVCASGWATDRLVPGAYATIQAAIDASAAGDVVRITVAGTYTEASQISLANKQITVQADVAGVVVDVPIICSGDTSSTLKGLTGNSLLSAHPCLALYDTAKIHAENCKFNGDNNDGVDLNSTNALTMIECEVMNNAWMGFRVQGTSSKLTLVRTKLTSNGQMGVGNYVQNGEFTIIGSEVKTNGIDGLYFEKPGVLTITDSNLEGNNGTAILTDGYNGATDRSIVSLTGTTVTANLAANPNPSIGQITLARGSDLTMQKCVVTASLAKGVVIDWFDSSQPPGTMVINECYFSGNAKTAIWFNSNTAAGSVSIYRSTVIDGSDSADWLLYPRNSNAFITDCLLVEGSNIIRAEGASVQVNQCTMVSRSGKSGVGFYNQWATGHKVINSIIDGPAIGFEAGAAGPGGVFNSYNLVRAATPYQNETQGSNNLINQDPKFVTPIDPSGNGNYHLQSTSPCIGYAGIAAPPVTIDIEGLTRPMPGGGYPNDMGAYEEQITPGGIEPPHAPIRNAAYSTSIVVNGDPAEWIGLASDNEYMTNINQGGNFAVNIKYAWNNQHLYMLCVEDPTSSPPLAQEAPDGAAYFGGPWSFDTIALFVYLTTGSYGQSNGDLQPWFGFSSIGRTDLKYARVNNGTDGTLAPLVNCLLATGGTYAAHNRVVEVGIKWTDIQAAVATSRQPGGNIVNAVQNNYTFGSQPLLVENDWNKQAFIGPDKWNPPNGVDQYSRDIKLIGGPTSVTDWSVY